jgi:hypothetical protein
MTLALISGIVSSLAADRAVASDVDGKAAKKKGDKARTNGETVIVKRVVARKAAAPPARPVVIRKRAAR